MQRFLIVAEQDIEELTVRITPRPKQVVTTTTHLINAIVLKAIGNYGHQRTQVWKVRPQPVSYRNMRSMQLTSACSPKAFARILKRKYIQVSDLGAMRRGESAQLALEI